MIASHIEMILYITGAATASMLGQFVAPRPLLRAFNGIEVDDPTALFFARGAGLAIGLIGVLIFWAAADPNLRVPVLAIAMVGKAAFVATIVSGFSGVGRKFMVAGIFDSICVLIYAGFLLGY